MYHVCWTYDCFRSSTFTSIFIGENSVIIFYELCRKKRLFQAVRENTVRLTRYYQGLLGYFSLAEMTTNLDCFRTMSQCHGNVIDPLWTTLLEFVNEPCLESFHDINLHPCSEYLPLGFNRGEGSSAAKHKGLEWGVFKRLGDHFWPGRACAVQLAARTWPNVAGQIRTSRLRNSWAQSLPEVDIAKTKLLSQLPCT